MTRVRHTCTQIVHEAKPDTKFKGRHYDFLCGQWCNLVYRDHYEKVEDDTPVTCKGCLRRMADKNEV